MTANSHKYSKILLSWYSENGRELPWRSTRDPYKIWLSEIILQQTRVEQGRAYYHAFTENYQDVQALAEAPQEEVLKTWQGLGYYSRARNLHATAKEVWENRGGRFPSTAKELLQLKGVGPYTAAAIASIAFDEDVPVIDGNVYRWITRLFGIEAPIDQKEGQKAVGEIANQLLPKGRAADFNQAMMDFGSQVCSPKNTQCAICPFKENCVAFDKDLVQILPIKAKKTKVQTVYLHYYVIEVDGQVLLKQRPNKGIWAGLYDFPLIESEQAWDIDKSMVELENLFNISIEQIEDVSEEMKHLLSHRKMLARFYRVKPSEKPKSNPQLSVWVKVKDVHKKPLPKLIENYWQTR